MPDQYSYSRDIRLVSQQDFTGVFSSAKKQKKANAAFVVYFTSQPTDPHARLGVITAKKQIKLAVHRNQVRRTVKEMFRLHQHQLNQYHIVVICLKKTQFMSAQEQRTCLKRLLPLSTVS